MISYIRSIFTWPTRKIDKIRNDLWVWQSESEPPVAEMYQKAGVDTLEKITDKLKDISDSDKVEELLEYCQSLYETEEKRREQTESKVTILAGFSGSATAGVLVLLNFFFDTLKQASGLIRFLGVGLSVLSIIGLVLSILYAVLALRVREHHFPKPMRIFKLSTQTLEDVKKRRSAEYFYSYVKNQSIDDSKVEAYKYASRTFRLSMYPVVALVLVLLGYSISTSEVVTSAQGVTPTTQATLVLTLTASPTTVPLTSTAVLTIQPIPSPTP